MGAAWPGAVGAIPQAVASPRGDAIAIRRDAASGAGIYWIDRDAATVTRLGTEAGIGPTCDHLAWTPDGEAILYHRRGGREGPDLWAVDATGTTWPVVEMGGAVQLVDVGDRSLLVIDRAAGALYRCDWPDGGRTPIRTEGGMIQGAVLHPGRERIAYTLSPTAEIDHSTVQLTDFQGAEHVPLGLDETAGVRDWTGSDLLVEVATMSTARPNIGWVTVPPEALNGTPEVTVRTVGSADLIEHPLGWLGGQRILAERRTREGTLEPVLYHRSGTATTVPIPPGVGDFIGEGYGAELTDGALAVGLETPHRGRGLYRFDPSTAELTHVDGPTASGSAATDRISHTVLERAQGVKVGVVTVRPRSPAASVPAVVRIPDRPQRQAWAGFDPVDAVFRACGIAVVRVTPRGGGAYLGGETDLRGTFGRGDQDDVAAAAEWATDRDWIDPTRIAIAGRHYGGFTTLHQLSRETTPFSAGVAWGSLVDLPALVRDDRAAERMVAALDRWLGELDRAEWRERSPISRADNLSGALGLVHELDDSLVPAEQSARLHQQMTRRADVDTEGYAYSRVESRQAARRFLLRFLVDRLASLGG